MDLLGTSKSGHKVSMDLAPPRLIVRSRPDPALLYLVLGAALLLGLLGTALGAHDPSVAEAGLFAALFSPIALFLVVSAVRLRATCTIDPERDEVRLHERRYLGHWERRYSLEQVGSLFLLPIPPTGPLGAGRSYLLCLAVPDGAYVLAESPYAQSLEPTGRVLARFLGMPLERSGHTVVTTGAGRRLLVGVLLYAVPVTAAVTALGLSLPERSSGWALLTILAAIALSQVGAILALLYYRRRPPEAAPGAQPVAPTQASAVPVGERERRT